MANSLIQIGGEVREMTAAELAQHQLDVAEYASFTEALQNKRIARNNALTKLEALGLTPAEVAALVGE
jgi:hypothetical protein